MISIYPFKAITPLKEQQPIIYDNFVSYYASELYSKNNSYKQKVLYLNNLLQKGLLNIDSDENFYCCRISNNFYSGIGVVGLIEANLVGKRLFNHERCISSKKKVYANLFKRYCTQISPVILVHKHNTHINKNIESLVYNNLPFLTIEDNDYKYEIWKVEEIDKYRKLYREIDCCIIADGHHRIAAANLVNMGENLMTGFFVSINYINTSIIFREYKVVDEISKNNLITFLKNNFSLIPISNNYLINERNFFIKIDLRFYKVRSLNSNEDIMNPILEFLDKYINYNNKKINFYNNLFTSKEEFVRSKACVSILIPAFNIDAGINSIVPLYPPHSTMFYPKLPEGLIINKICASDNGMKL